eukprot:38178-Eustigmatos_ZCMA.PRE.1
MSKYHVQLITNIHVPLSCAESDSANPGNKAGSLNVTVQLDASLVPPGHRGDVHGVPTVLIRPRR